jgi:hypothetical protein
MADVLLRKYIVSDWSNINIRTDCDLKSGGSTNRVLYVRVRTFPYIRMEGPGVTRYLIATASKKLPKTAICKIFRVSGTSSVLLFAWQCIYALAYISELRACKSGQSDRHKLGEGERSTGSIEDVAVRMFMLLQSLTMYLRRSTSAIDRYRQRKSIQQLRYQSRSVDTREQGPL